MSCGANYQLTQDIKSKFWPISSLYDGGEVHDLYRELISDIRRVGPRKGSVLFLYENDMQEQCFSVVVTDLLCRSFAKTDWIYVMEDFPEELWLQDSIKSKQLTKSISLGVDCVRIQIGTSYREYALTTFSPQ